MNDTAVAVLLGVCTILFSGVVSAVVTYSLNRSKERSEFFRLKAERLYLAVDQYGKALGGQALTYFPLLEDKITWDQLREVQMSNIVNQDKHDGAEVMEMLVALYFPQVSPQLDALFLMRDRMSKITHGMKERYEELGYVPIDEFYRTFHATVQSINEKVTELQSAVLKEARRTVRDDVGSG